MCETYEWSVGKVLREMATGDAVAFQNFVATGLPSIIKILRHFFKRHNLADDRIDDCIQETLLKTIKTLRKYHEKDVNATWLMKVARSVLLDHIRKTGKTETVSEQLLVTQPDEPTQNPNHHKHELSEYIYELLSKMPQDDQTLIVMLYINDFTIDEVARTLGIGRQAAYKRHARAMERLRNLAASDPMD